MLLVKLATLSINLSAAELTVATGQNLFFPYRFLFLSDSCPRDEFIRRLLVVPYPRDEFTRRLLVVP
jgi:hypothetical protein